MLLAPLLLNGCMMAGMAGTGRMGTGMNAASARSEPTVIKEVSGSGFRVTVEFPYYASVDSSSYTVTVRGADGQLIRSDALVALEVSLEPPIVVEHRVVLPAPTTMSGNTAHT